MTYYCEDDVTKNGFSYACGVVVLCNIMKYFRSRGFTNISYDFSSLYQFFWNETTPDSNGYTNFSRLTQGAVIYLSEVGYGASSSSTFDSYNNYIYEISNGRPCILGYGATFNGQSGGHFVCVVGYAETTSYQYLRVADGWNSYVRYINYNGYNYNWKSGSSIGAAKF